MQRDEYVLSQQGSFPSINDSSSNPYQYSQFPNVNVSEKSQQGQKNSGSNRLDDIISKAFKNLQNEEQQTINYDSQYQNERMRLDFESMNHNNTNRGQKRNRFFFNIENQTQSIVNSSNKDSFQRSKQRVPGKLTQSYESLQKNQLKRSQDDDHYYNFTIKNSTLNSEYLFNDPEFNQSPNSDINYWSKLQQTSFDHVNHPSYLQASNHKNQQNYHHGHVESPKLPISNRSGFIRQNKLNSRSKSKQKQLSGSLSSHASTKNRKLIAQQEQFRIHYQQPKKNSKHHQILDEDFWRKLDEHKSTSESLKQTFDSQKTNNYQLNSLLNNNTSIRKKDRTHYSEIDRDHRFNDSICSSEGNPYIKEYENDLFDFIKKELISTTVENKELSQKEKEVINEYNSQKKKNASLYHLYKKTQVQIGNLIENQSDCIDSMKVQVKLLEEQILFYRQHSITIEQSIAAKIKKQENFYFRHKANLQEIILSNNQQITNLKNQLFKVQHLHKRQTKDQEKSEKIGNLESSRRQNQKLKEKLREQQLLYERSLKKLAENHSKIQDLQNKKAEQIKALVEEFQNVKRLVYSLK